MTPSRDEAPAWIARSLDAHTVDEVQQLLLAVLEYAGARLLSELLDKSMALERAVDDAVRITMAGPMDLEGWHVLVQSMLASPRCAPVLGFDADTVFPATHPAALARRAMKGGSEGEVGAREFLATLVSALPRGEVDPEIAASALRALVGAAPCFAHETPVHVQRVTRDGNGWKVEYLALVGVGEPQLRQTVLEDPPMDPGRLYYWDGGSGATSPAAWLAFYDERVRAMRIYAGRHPRTNEWLHRARGAVSDTASCSVAPVGLPVTLSEPVWMTDVPAPQRTVESARRTEEFDEDEHTETGEHPLFVTSGVESSPLGADLGEFSLDAVHALFGTDADEVTQDGIVDVLGMVALFHGKSGPAALSSLQDGSRVRTLLVVAGPLFLTPTALVPASKFVIGRTRQFADHVVPDRSVSASHVEVTVGASGAVEVHDLRSTNGTWVNGRRLGREHRRLAPGDLLQVGSVPMRLEELSAAQSGRLAEIQGLRGDRRHDPVTGLLRSRYLDDTIGSLREAGLGRSMYGLMFVADELGSIHLAHGRKGADEAFRNVASLVLYAADDPRLCCRVGFGEVLVLVPMGSSAVATRVGDAVLQTLTDRPIGPNLERIPIRAATASLRADEEVHTWLFRLRQVLHDGAGRGRDKVLVVP